MHAHPNPLPRCMGMDTFGSVYDSSLARAARAAAGEVLGLRRGERVLIITNPQKEVSQISMALFDAAIERNAVPVLIVQKQKGQFDFAEEEVMKAMTANPPVVVSISHDRLGKDRFGLTNGYKGKKRRYDNYFDLLYEEGMMRGFWSPGVTVDIFSRTVPIDYRQMRSDAARLCRKTCSNGSIHVTAPGGTDIVVGVKGRKCRPDDGNFTKGGRVGNLPAGEVYVSPALGTAQGTIAFDGSIVLNKGEIVVKHPIVAEVSKGYITSISGGEEARLLKASVQEGEAKARRLGRSGQMKPKVAEMYARNAWSIGELGIGLNRKARVVANMLEDEKVYGTCHFAVGSNYDGDAEAMIHLDGLVKRPTISVVSEDGREEQVMVDGRLVWD